MNTVADGESAASNTLMQALGVMSADEQARCAEDHLCTLFAQTLRMDAGKIDRQRSLAQMGIDSLMAAELQSGIGRVFGVRISTLELMRAQSLSNLVALLLEKTEITIGMTAGSASPPPDQTPASELLARLSTEEVDGLLQQLMNEKEPSHA
ncbi:MAG: acyl carrier protein [Nitrosomonas sp.]|nr:acyl carrier protein [Nitrosomonas sp.]